MVTLNNAQEAHLAELVCKLESGHTRLRAADAPTAEFSNVFGILGPRGAGKSTLLSQFYRSKPELGPLLVLRPLDCSTVLPGVEPGMAILLHLEPQIRKAFPQLDEKLWNDLLNVISIYLNLTGAFRELKLDLASSPGSFGKSLVNDVKSRLALGMKLAEWLADLLKAMGKYEGLVVLLDDFDLIPANEVRGWFRCLFDDLRQPTLLFVLTGDFHRLEHLIFDPKAGIDDKTGRAQLEKLLPWQHRLTLEPWKGPISLHFKYHGEHAVDLNNLLEKQWLWSHSRRMLIPLLPSLPRGLENLHRSLAGERTAAESLELKKFLVLLATCRGEPLWSRRLDDHELKNWEGIFQFTSTDLPFEDWRQTVRAARQRGPTQEADFVDPLRGLTPVLAGTSDPRLRSITSDLRARSRVVRLEGSENPEASDPLRHGELWVAPLRDTDPMSEPYWVELLLDLSFSETVADAEWRRRNRVHFLEAWRPARKRLDASKLEATLTTRQIRAFFEDYGDSAELHLGSLLFWFTWQRHVEGNLAAASFGWPVLLEGLRQRRPVLPTAEASGLGLDIHALWRSRDTFDSTALEIVPDRVWAAIVLVDALDRCSWPTFSARLGWHLPTYLALAGALVQSAYAYALVSTGAAAESDFAEGQQRMIEVLRHRHPGYVLGETAAERYEEAVFQRLEEVLCAPFPAGDPDNPLWRSANAFFGIPPYLALRKMVENEGLLL
jgi:hypothetical protein